MPRTEVVGVKSSGKRLQLKLNDNKSLEVDYVVVAVGVEANTELAKESDLEVDPEIGGFLVNTELQARTDLYIVSDIFNVIYYLLITKQKQQRFANKSV